jgi:DNA-binding IclR family transcriptional regulator
MESYSACRNDAPGSGVERASSLDKALELCESLAGASRGLALAEVARRAKLPPSTAHRLLGVLRRRGYVRQDEESARYHLTLKMLDLSFRWLGRSELRLHAYPVLREYVLRTGGRAFLAVGTGEVTYLWAAGPDEVGMYTAYGREMPTHCSEYLGVRAEEERRLTCVKLAGDVTGGGSGPQVRRFGVAGAPGPRLNCTCAPVMDYTGREVARVGVFGHDADDRVLCEDGCRQASELARLVSLRLGHLPAVPLAVTA